jgi:hypothetical protein
MMWLGLLQEAGVVLCGAACYGSEHISNMFMHNSQVEHPDLIFRMSYYMHVRSLDELPIDVQNIMVSGTAVLTYESYDMMGRTWATRGGKPLCM